MFILTRTDVGHLATEYRLIAGIFGDQEEIHPGQRENLCFTEKIIRSSGLGALTLSMFSESGLIRGPL